MPKSYACFVFKSKKKRADFLKTLRSPVTSRPQLLEALLIDRDGERFKCCKRPVFTIIMFLFVNFIKKFIQQFVIELLRFMVPI